MEQMLIDGKLVGADSGRTFADVNPATEDVLGVAPDAGAAEMDRAIEAARRAFDGTAWSTDHELRRRCITQILAAVDAEREALRDLLVAESGVPVALTHGFWLDLVLDGLPWFAELATSYAYDQEIPGTPPLGPARRMIFREATGVVGAITPWNYTVPSNLCKIVPALAAGCTVVLKPAPDTPWAATRLAALVAERTDTPPGVVNVVTSSDHLVGEVLTTDPRVDMIAFTGSTAVGKRVMAKAAGTVKKLGLELGGKSATVVLDDADIAQVVGQAGGICVHAGQGCAIPTRMLVPRSRYDEAVDVARASFESVVCGDPTDPAVTCGPLISARQRDRVLGYIATGRSEARLVVGGGVPDDRSRGFFVEPTLFADVDPGATIAQDEIFGPVLVLIPYDGDDEAVRIANDSRYGLSGAVHGGDPARATAVARRIRTGTMSVNGASAWGMDSPFGGYRQSGLGREFGVEGFEEFLETKSIGLPPDAEGAR